MDSEGSLWVGGLHLGEGALASWGVSGPAAAGRELCCAWPSASGTVGPSCGAMRFFMRDSTPPHEGLCVPSCPHVRLCVPSCGAVCPLMWGPVPPHVLMGDCVLPHVGLCVPSCGAVCPLMSSWGAVCPFMGGCVPCPHVGLCVPRVGLCVPSCGAVCPSCRLRPGAASVSLSPVSQGCALC